MAVILMMGNKENEEKIEFDMEQLKLSAEFKPSNITVIEGSVIQNILFNLCIDSIISLDKDVIYIDGYNTFNPYIIQRMIKPLRIEQKKILSRIHIARAFTEYQMETLIKRLDSAIREWSAKVLIISYLPILFYSSNNSPNKNKKRLLESSIKHLRFITTSSNMITVITSLGHSCSEDKLLASKADRVIRIENTKDIIRIIEDERVTEHVHVPSGQMRFSDF